MQNLFLDGQTVQYGSHMVMTGGSKPHVRTMYINIDTRFRDVANSSTLADYTFTLPERLNNVRSMEVVGIELPNTIYNFSSSLGNTTFTLSKSPLESKYNTITIDDANYSSPSGLVTVINANIAALAATDASYSHFSLSAATVAGGGYRCIMNNGAAGTTLYAVFAERGGGGGGGGGGLGWKLGFRESNYKIGAGVTVSGESFMDIFSPKYVYLVIEDYSKSSANKSFISPYFMSVMNKNIIAKIPISAGIISGTKYNFGDMINANIVNGSMMSDVRTYGGAGDAGVDLQRLRIQLVDEFGNIVDLNEMDFSFSMKLEL
jgi:hypothetical protein